VEPTDIDGIGQALEKILFSNAPMARTRIDRFRWSNLAQDYLNAIETARGAPAAALTPQLAARDTSSHTTPAGKSA